MKHIFAVLCLSAMPGLGLAQSMVCKIEGDVIAPRSIEWDIKTRAAKLTDFLDVTHFGALISVRKFNAGVKVNLRFEFKPDHYGVTSAEFMVFPELGSAFRVVGAGYATVDGQLLLTQSYGNYSAKCLSL